MNTSSELLRSTVRASDPYDFIHTRSCFPYSHICLLTNMLIFGTYVYLICTESWLLFGVLCLWCSIQTLLRLVWIRRRGAINSERTGRGSYIRMEHVSAICLKPSSSLTGFETLRPWPICTGMRMCFPWRLQSTPLSGKGCPANVNTESFP